MFDLAIIGAGPAGMAAATQAASLGLAATLFDEQSAPGGQIYRGLEAVQNTRANDMSILGEEYAAGTALAASFRASGCDYAPGSMVWQVREDGTIGVSRGGESRLLAARQIIIATGAMERPVPIPGWTLPGVMSAGAAQALLKASGVVPNGPVVILGAGPLIYLIATQLARAGVRIAAVLLTEPEIGMMDALRLMPEAIRTSRMLLKGLTWISELRNIGVRIIYGVSRPVIEGDRQAEAVSYIRAATRHRIPASMVLLHNGVIPGVQIGLGAGCEQEWNVAQHCWQPRTDEWGATNQARIAIAGDGAGIFGAQAAEILGRLAALNAAARLDKLNLQQRDRLAREDCAELARQQSLRHVLDRLFPPAQELLAPTGAEDIVCRCEEITVGELRDAITKGNTDVNRVKAYTRCGMGPCQGRLCGPVAAEVIARTLGQAADKPGQFRHRLPLRPVPLAELAQLR